ncbi:MAG TPA: IclR family transcriptional regulator C-terminal domain-containing protein, partial [Dongiaceae bacterium]
VATTVGISRAAVRRALLTLAELGYVSVDGKLYQLTPSVLRLGFSYISSQPLCQIAQSHIDSLSEKFHESSSVTVLDGGEIVYVARAVARRIMSVWLNTGSRLPAYCTSMGRVLLSALGEPELQRYFKATQLIRYTDRTQTDEKEIRRVLDQVREKGYCIVDQEREIGLRSIAVPIRNRAGKVVAAMNLSGQSGRIELRQMRDEIRPALLAAAQSISSVVPE